MFLPTRTLSRCTSSSQPSMPIPPALTSSSSPAQANHFRHHSNCNQACCRPSTNSSSHRTQNLPVQQHGNHNQLSHFNNQQSVYNVNSTTNHSCSCCALHCSQCTASPTPTAMPTSSTTTCTLHSSANYMSSQCTLQCHECVNLNLASAAATRSRHLSNTFVPSGLYRNHNHNNQHNQNNQHQRVERNVNVNRTWQLDALNLNSTTLALPSLPPLFLPRPRAPRPIYNETSTVAPPISIARTRTSNSTRTESSSSSSTSNNKVTTTASMGNNSVRIQESLVLAAAANSARAQPHKLEAPPEPAPPEQLNHANTNTNTNTNASHVDDNETERNGVTTTIASNTQSSQQPPPPQAQLQHVCGECGRAFRYLSLLQRHETSHSTVKPIECDEPGCGKRFQHKYHLAQHKRRTHDAIKRFHCEFAGCGKSFVEKCNLKVHLRSHTGEKPFLCGQCGRRFSIKTNLDAHLRIHSGEKPFECPYNGCKKRFARKAYLTKHVRKHTGE